jgi:Protein of unknown function (DUF3551)
MRLPILSLLLISAVSFGEMHAASAQSPTYPWCSRSGDGESCYFASKEQCQGTTSRVGAFCIANRNYRPSPPASDEAVNAPRPPGAERVGARQSPAVRAKQSASTGERSPGSRLDVSAAGAQVPKQETRSLPSEDADSGECGQ